jgi:hypothetical protein
MMQQTYAEKNSEGFTIFPKQPLKLSHPVLPG